MNTALVGRVLRAVLEREPVDVAAIATALGEPAGDVEASVGALADAGLVAAAGPGWRAGPVIVTYARREALVDAAGPVLRRLAEESGETANLVLPRAVGTEAIAQHDGRHLLGATNWVGRELPLHCTAAGKLFLAFGATTLPEGELAACTAATIVDRSALERELDAVREQGYATLVDELEDGLSVVGAPVRDAGGTVVAALTVAGATLRLPPARLRLLGRVTLEQAAVLAGAIRAPL